MNAERQNSATILPEHNIRRANPQEIMRVCSILASAFATDPVMNWISPQCETYASMFRADAQSLYFKCGSVFINQNHTGAAMWLPPEVKPQPPLSWAMVTMLWKMLTKDGLGSIQRGNLLERELYKWHPDQAHFYLHSVGAAQGHQGKGIGSALLREGLELCDAQGMPAYLVSSNRKNNELYQRFGFEIREEIQLPNNGPTVWSMWREASSH